jgi:predicted site-specific integrase-resolvase
MQVSYSSFHWRRVEVALYARVSSADQKEDVERQMQRLLSYAAAKGYAVCRTVTEIASGLNDNRPKQPPSPPLIRGTNEIVDKSQNRRDCPELAKDQHRDRLTRFGFNYIAKLLEARGGRIEVIFPDVGLSPTITTHETKDELVDDFVAVITSMRSFASSGRIYGRRNAKRRAAQIKQCIMEGVSQASHAEELK